MNYHLKAIFAEGELQRDATIRYYRIVRIEGARQITREIEHYNLGTILAVGFRGRSHRGTQFAGAKTATIHAWHGDASASGNAKPQLGASAELAELGLGDPGAYSGIHDTCKRTTTAANLRHLPPPDRRSGRRSTAATPADCIPANPPRELRPVTPPLRVPSKPC